MTRFKKFIKDYRLKDWKFMDFVRLALVAVLMVASSLVAVSGMVYGIILLNVWGFTNASNEGGSLSATVMIDIILLAIVVVIVGAQIEDWLDERRRKKYGLPRNTEPPGFEGFHP